uniref:Solute carrier family 15 member 5 n=1 Tax=Neogobius melanostomus TaxID=47308 RepID=A0A8C6UI82_9GOBI
MGASTLTPVLVGWFAETCLGRTKVLYLCAFFHFFGTAMLPVVAFPFEDFYIDNHQITHQLEPREQQILFYIGLLAAVLGVGGIRAILCPMGAYSLQSYSQHQLLSFFNWWIAAYYSWSVLKLLENVLHTLSPYKRRSPSWLDRAKENNGGRYSETHVENVKVLARLFPLYGLQLFYRICTTQIPSSYYIQTMNSNLHMRDLLLPIGVMNVISILPLLLLAPLIELVTSCYLAMGKSAMAPVKVITLGHVFAALSVLLAGLSELQRKTYPLVEQTLSGKVLQVSSMPCYFLAPQYILLGIAEALVTPTCSMISFQLTPRHIRGISLHFLTLSYGWGCFLGTVMILLSYLFSGGNFYPNVLQEGNLERFFFLLAILMAVNTFVFWRISHRYLDLTVQGKTIAASPLTEKLLQYKACLKFYNTMEHSYINSIESI